MLAGAFTAPRCEVRPGSITLATEIQRTQRRTAFLREDTRRAGAATPAGHVDGRAVDG